MRHYEIVIMIHPDQSDQMPAMVEKYRSILSSNQGLVHRFEDWGRRPLAYPINKLHKAHYVLLNIECNQTALNELSHTLRFNDAVIRHLVLSTQEAITEPSAMMKEKEFKDTAIKVHSTRYVHELDESGEAVLEEELVVEETIEIDSADQENMNDN